MLPAVDVKTAEDMGIKLHLLPQLSAKGKYSRQTVSGALCVESRTVSSLLVFRNSRFGECKDALGGQSE